MSVCTAVNLKKWIVHPIKYYVGDPKFYLTHWGAGRRGSRWLLVTGHPQLAWSSGSGGFAAPRIPERLFKSGRAARRLELGVWRNETAARSDEPSVSPTVAQPWMGLVLEDFSKSCAFPALPRHKERKGKTFSPQEAKKRSKKSYFCSIMLLLFIVECPVK